MREGGFLIEVVGDGVGVVRLSAVWLLVLTVSLVASEPARRKSATEHLGNISTCMSATEILRRVASTSRATMSDVVMIMCVSGNREDGAGLMSQRS